MTTETQKKVLMHGDGVVAKAGTLLCVTEGCYSDFGVNGFFVVLSDFTPSAELAAYLIEHPEQCGNYSFQSHAFMAALLKKGFLLEVGYSELHMGDYSRAGEVGFSARTGAPQ
jgi:hypothetical protein